jgi:hypothetical protein
MPLQKLQFRPGVNREGTTLSNEGGWFDCDKIRFRSGYPEKIGGWVLDTGTAQATLKPPTGSYWGVARSMYNWVNLAGYNLLGIGTNLKYYIQNSPNGLFYDITPIRVAHAGITNAFTTTNSSTTVTVNDPAHGAQTGDFVTISAVAGAVNGIPAANLNAEFQITYINSNQYNITTTAAATSSGTAGTATFTYQINTGFDIYTVQSGWGAGTWGGVAVGTASTTLNGTITSGATSIILTDASTFSAAGTIVIDSESITYSGKSTNTLTGCTRGANGSHAAAHTSGAAVLQSTSFTGWGLASSSGVGAQLRLWSQAQFGQDLIINPRGGALYHWGNNANPNIFDRAVLMSGGDTPTVCNYVLVSDASRFVLAFGVNDYGLSVQDPMLVRWSDQESYTSWTPADTNQAGSYRLSQGSTIITALQTRQEVLVWTDAALYSMQYLGPPYVWGFQTLGSNLSIAGPNVAATVNNVTYWMGTDKFYMYSGRVETLPCALRQYIFDDINMQQSYQFFTGTNEGYNEIWWFYCSANSVVIDKYVIYNHLERTWYYGTMERTAWCDSPLRTEPMSAGYGGQLIYQETGVDDGSTNPGTLTPIDAYVQSSDFDIGDGHNFGFVWRLIPDVSFDGSTATAPQLNFTVRPRTNPGANYGDSDNPAVVSVNNYAGQRTYNVQQFTQQVYVRIRGRQMAFRVESNTLGVQWQLGSPRIDVRPDGRR